MTDTSTSTTTPTTTPTTPTSTPTSTPTVPTSITTLIDGYFECWNTADADERRSLVERVYTPDGHVVDPLIDVTGHAELFELFTTFHVTYAGHSFRRAGGVDVHHDLVRWGWEMLDADGNIVLDGLDVALLADGQLSYVAGFFGAALPA